MGGGGRVGTHTWFVWVHYLWFLRGLDARGARIVVPYVCSFLGIDRFGSRFFFLVCSRLPAG